MSRVIFTVIEGFIDRYLKFNKNNIEMLSRFQSMTFLGYALGLIIAIQPSYIHPDEHFQTLEILSQAFGGIKGTIPWEFQTNNAARSYVPLYLMYGPLYFIMFKLFHIQNPVIILFLVRLQTYFAYIIVFRSTFKRLCKSKRYDAIEFLVATSYATSSLQSHTFSNSVETMILLGLLASYEKLISSRKQQSEGNYYLVSTVAAILIVIGTFNRMTFPAFILLPSIRVFFKYYIRHFKSFMSFLFTISITCLVFIQIDTCLFKSDTYVIAPWNNLQYNLDISNLQMHGLHHKYTHLLINLPQLLGPLLILILTTLKYRKFRDLLQRLPSLSIISALAILSFFPHQELRFLIPLLPLIFITFHDIHSKLWLRIWLSFNITLAIIMGCFHQSGIIRVIAHYQHQDHLELGVHIWWKTYMPPTWMYLNENLTVSTTKIVNTTEMVDFNNLQNVTHEHIIDLKGCDSSLLDLTLSQMLDEIDEVTLIVPTSMRTKLFTLKSNYTVIEDFHTFAHLDLDHFNINDLTTFIPGISSYKVSKLI